jgi:hypothetical protein
MNLKISYKLLVCYMYKHSHTLQNKKENLIYIMCSTF